MHVCYLHPQTMARVRLTASHSVSVEALQCHQA